MKTKGWLTVFMLSLSLCTVTSCGGNTSGGSQAAAYEQISAEEAKEIMDTEKNCIIIDARTEAEFDEGHIKDAILIPE